MSFPPLAALFLTHFDDIQGQSVVFYTSTDPAALPPALIEHTTLPSGLHALPTDLIPFTHHRLPGIGLFRSKPDDGGRGRRMGTLGVVLAPPGTPADLFGLGPLLAGVYDSLEAASDAPFSAAGATDVLQPVFERHRAMRAADGIGIAVPSPPPAPSARHPISHLSALLGVLGPALVPVYRGALAGRRILLHSPPPLLPVGAYAWCIHALSLLPPTTATLPSTSSSEWIGNVGLMDLDALKCRPSGSGWVATTSDAIFRLHPTAYDIFVDLSNPHAPELTSTSLRGGSGDGSPQAVGYAFADLPLYRSLVRLAGDPAPAGLWMFALEVLERVWRVCVGVCDYARGRAGSGAGAGWRLGSGLGLGRGDEEEEEDEGARLLRVTEEDGSEGDEEEEAARRGRLVLGQLQHNSFHLHARLRAVTSTSGSADKGERLTEPQLRELCGTRWSLFGAGDLAATAEGRWWDDLARLWGFTTGPDGS